jgi:Regulator of chromosome condensation (RCC1) repeat
MLRIWFASSTGAILDNGGVKCWGTNSQTAGVTTQYGQLGTGNQENLLMPAATPVNLGAGRTAKAIAAGRAHVCVVSVYIQVHCVYACGCMCMWFYT